MNILLYQTAGQASDNFTCVEVNIHIFAWMIERKNRLHLVKEDTNVVILKYPRLIERKDNIRKS